MLYKYRSINVLLKNCKQKFEIRNSKGTVKQHLYISYFNIKYLNKIILNKISFQNDHSYITLIAMKMDRIEFITVHLYFILSY